MSIFFQPPDKIFNNKKKWVNMHLRRFPPYKYHKLDLYLSRPIFRYLLTDSKQPQLRKDRLKCFTILLKETRNEAESNFSSTKLFMSKNIENASPVRELVKIDMPKCLGT